MELARFVKEKRKAVNLTQPELAAKAGVGLRFVRELEQGKQSLRLDKVNQVLRLFDYEVGKGPSLREAQEKPGNIPYISSTGLNNGVACYTSIESTHPGNQISYNKK
jgi:y4mF family transcriptional regulator